MRILLVTHYFPAHGGGVESVAYQLGSRLAMEPDLQVEWMASDCDPIPAALPERLRCIPVRSWNGVERRSGLPVPVWSPAALLRLWRAVGECDVVHVHDAIYMGNAAACLFAAIRGKPVVVTQHLAAIPYKGRVARNLLSLLNRSLVRAVLTSAHKVVFYSPAVQRYYEEYCRFSAPPAFVPNGVDTNLFGYVDSGGAAKLRQSAGRDPGRPQCLFVGRFVDRKGVALVLAMARQLPGVDWILVGYGPIRPEDAGLPNLSVLRACTGAGLALQYQMADLLVLPSSGEGFPLAVQEAMACGTPAFVSPETAEGCPGVRPLLFTADVLAQNAAEEWRGRIAGLVGDIDALRAMRSGVADAAREQWSWPAAARAYAALFREVRIQ